MGGVDLTLVFVVIIAMLLCGLGLFIAGVSLKMLPIWARILLMVLGGVITLFVLINFGFSFLSAAVPML